MKKESFAIRFLYGTIPGRCLLKLLVLPGFSRAAARYLESSLSRWMVPLYIRKFGVELRDCERKTYRSFEDFFIRKRREERLLIDREEGHLISPCDGLLSIYSIGKNSAYWIKHVEYGLLELLQSKKLAEKFRGGICMVFRLTPGHYHRYCHIDEGCMEPEVRIPGVLHCVRPIALKAGPVFLRNSRVYTLIHTEHFGDVVQMEVGALLVGRIHNHPLTKRVARGQEKGYFQFGGSTVILLFERGRVLPDRQIWKRTQWKRETDVRMGERIGEAAFTREACKTHDR